MSDEAAENKQPLKYNFKRHRWPDKAIEKIEEINSSFERLRPFSDEVDNINSELKEAIRLLKVYQEAGLALARACNQVGSAEILADKEFRRLEDPMKSAFFNGKFALMKLHEDLVRQEDEFYNARLIPQEPLKSQDR